MPRFFRINGVSRLNSGRLKIIIFSALFFYLFVPFAYAALPTVGTLTPSSGSVAPNIAKTFTCKYSDYDGWQNLKEAYFLVSTGTSALANSVYLYYDQNTNLLYLSDDANTAWLGGYAPGSANTIENSQVKLNCALTAATGATNTLTVSWNITFKSAYSGKSYYTYLKAVDDTSGSSGWKNKGSYSVNNKPTLGTIAPSSGTGQKDVAQTFIASYSDADGWANLKEARLLINASTSTANCFYAYYNQNTNLLYLRNDANTAWLGGYAPGSANTIENSYAKLNYASTSIIGSGNTMTVNWSVVLRPPFTGAKNTYLYVVDDTGAYAGFSKVGTWILPNQAPSNGQVSPAFGASIPNQTFYFTASYSDPDGWQNIQYPYLLINSASASKTNCFYAYYDKSTNKLYLRNTADTSWLGGYAPGSNNIIQNSYCTLNCSQTTVSGTGNTITVKWAVTFKSTFLGTKNIYLYVKDYAGAYQNWAQKGTWVALSSGTVIGPSGGETTSSNGKVKIIIPSGALSDPTAISISSVDKTTLENLAPPNTNLLSVVDCQPYGLVFNQPVQIIYALDQAEIPGTPVELGLYDSIQNKIIPTGDVSTIPQDGYSVTFSILHFSTYAALLNLTPQNAPIGSGVKIPLPDMFTGAFSYAIPITVAPGRKGMQPALGLSYRSGGANSWVGLGFSLNPGYITRSTKLGPPTYIDTQDTFYLITDAGTTELVYLVDNLYQAKIESSFTKFYKETDDSWKVVGKDGSVLRFGQSSDTKEGSTQGTFSWYVTRAQDTNGNYISYAYTKDQGKSYLSRIDYTGHSLGIAPTNTVEFFLEPRDDITSSYLSSARVAIAKRLKEIAVKVNSALVWRYVLEYAYSPDTNRSLLRSVTQSGVDGKALPQQKLIYQKSK
ncbi:MAG: SpvB/TcaC N-terminal domain-containing protein [Candidatus Omnitrophota bacterium]